MLPGFLHDSLSTSVALTVKKILQNLYNRKLSMSLANLRNEEPFISDFNRNLRTTEPSDFLVLLVLLMISVTHSTCGV